MKYSFGLSISIMYSVIITMHSHYLQASEPRESPKSTVRSGGMPRITLLPLAQKSTIAAFLANMGVDTTDVSEEEQNYLLKGSLNALGKAKAIPGDGFEKFIKAHISKLEASHNDKKVLLKPKGKPIKKEEAEKSDSFKDGTGNVHSLIEPFEGDSTLRKPLGTGQELKEANKDILPTGTAGEVDKLCPNLSTLSLEVFSQNNLKDVERARVSELSNPDKNYCTLRKPLRREQGLEE
jgi:hypothetical protein